MKKLLLIMNPCAGMKRANHLLPEIISVFGRGDYETTVFMTEKRGDGTTLAERYAPDMDVIACVGGDGTFNEVISGVCRSGCQTPIGYIPAGSTNDFAASLKLSKNIVQAAQDIVWGHPKSFDVGKFRDRYFTYVASFGAFTKVSYATSQNIKNALGHLAYILGGIKELASLRKWHCRLETDEGQVMEDDYIFGAVSNSTSVGGILTLDPEIVDMNDGVFELLLIKSPANVLELNECIRALTAQDYSSPMLRFCPARKVTVTAAPEMDWTLDGEYAPGSDTLVIENLHNAVDVLVNQ